MISFVLSFMAFFVASAIIVSGVYAYVFREELHAYLNSLKEFSPMPGNDSQPIQGMEANFRRVEIPGIPSNIIPLSGKLLDEFPVVKGVEYESDVEELRVNLSNKKKVIALLDSPVNRISMFADIYPADISKLMDAHSRSVNSVAARCAQSSAREHARYADAMAA